MRPGNRHGDRKVVGEGHTKRNQKEERGRGRSVTFIPPFSASFSSLRRFGLPPAVMPERTNKVGSPPLPAAIKVSRWRPRSPCSRRRGACQGERRVVEYVDAHRDEAVALLEKVVNIPSATNNLAGVREVGKVFEAEFARIGFTTRWEEMPRAMNRAGHLIAEHAGTRGKRLLLIGHLDTVLEGRPFRRDPEHPDRATGNGTVDMKGGDVVMLYALKALARRRALEGRQVAVILTGDEESAGLPDRDQPRVDARAGPAERRRPGLRGRRGADGHRRPPRGRVVVAAGQGAHRAIPRASSAKTPAPARSTSRPASSTSSAASSRAEGPDRSTPAWSSAGPNVGHEPGDQRRQGRGQDQRHPRRSLHPRRLPVPHRRPVRRRRGRHARDRRQEPAQDLGRVRVRGRIPRDGPDAGQLRGPRRPRPRQPRPRHGARSPRSTR